MDNGVNMISDTMIEGVREASRLLVRELGLMNRTVAGTDLSVSAVHAIIEIGAVEGLSARDLSEKLVLEKSSVSRLVRSLVNRGLVSETKSDLDGRIKFLSLSTQGRKLLAQINDFARRQVSNALCQLESSAQRRVLNGIKDYSRCAWAFFD